MLGDSFTASDHRDTDEPPGSASESTWHSPPATSQTNSAGRICTFAAATASSGASSQTRASRPSGGLNTSKGSCAAGTEERFGSLTRAADADDIVYGGRLPELPGERLDFEWGFTTTGSDRVRRAVVLHGGTEIWRDTSNVFPGGQLRSSHCCVPATEIGSRRSRTADVGDDLREARCARPRAGARRASRRGPVTAYEWSCELCGAPAGSVSVDGGRSVRREGFATGSMNLRLSETEADALRHALGRGDAAEAYAIDYELAPWWCPECEKSYCGEHWEHSAVYDQDCASWLEYIQGRCPQGHGRELEDQTETTRRTDLRRSAN